MSVITKQLANRVLRLLTQYPDLRDENQKLLAMIWREDIGESNHLRTDFAILGDIFNKKVTHPESVLRCWRKVLEENPILRGPNYEKRHNDGVSKAKKNIKDIAKVVRPQNDINFDD